MDNHWGSPINWHTRGSNTQILTKKRPQIMRFDPQVPIYRVLPNYFLIDIEDKASRVNLNVVLWILCVI